MSILILREYKDAPIIKDALQKELPGEAMEIYPKVKDPMAIDFIVTFKPRKEALEEFPNAKVIQSLGAGVNYILDTKALKKEMTLARIVDPYLSSDMWEFTLGVVVAEMKNLPLYQAYQKKAYWKKRRYSRFQDTTIGILGLGKIGAFVAEKFASLGFKVKGWSNSKKNIIGVESYVGMEALPQALDGVNFLINILPLTAQTKRILGKATLQHLPKGAFLINVGRGMHNQESELIELLDSEQLSGILLDVFDTEPLPTDHPFWSHPKVKITPHIASVTNLESASVEMAENYRRFKAGLPLKNVVSFTKGY